MSTAIEKHQASQELALQDELTIDQLVAQVTKIQQAMEKVMQKGEHYGVIRGTNRPTLLKAGAEKLCLLFRLNPEYEVIREEREDGHLTVTATCTLFHIPTGNRVASGVGLCSTRERKYAYVRGAPNTSLPDTWNTVVKMACKRGLVAAVLNGTAASDIFTQDLEDLAGGEQQAPAAPPQPLSPAKLEELLVALNLVNYAPEFWAIPVVLANASRRFGRPIERVADLADGEANQIIAGAQQYFLDNPPTAEKIAETLPSDPVDPDPAPLEGQVEIPIDEDIPFGDAS